MKKFVMMAACLVSSMVAANAQKSYRTEFPNSNNRVVRMIVNHGDVEVIPHDGKDVELVVSGEWSNPNEEERAQGLRLISSEGEDNTDIGVFQSTEGDILSFTQLGNSSREFTLKVPRDASVQLQEASWMGASDFVVSGIGGEVEVDAKNGDIVMREITGPVVINAMNGDVDLVFSEVSQESPMSITTQNGAIDLTIPANSKGTLGIRTFQGEVFTDLDLDIDRQQGSYGTAMEGKLNGGGVRMDLKAMNGNIFLRKK